MTDSVVVKTAEEDEKDNAELASTQEQLKQKEQQLEDTTQDLTDKLQQAEAFAKRKVVLSFVFASTLF